MLMAAKAVVESGRAAQRPDLLHVGLRRRGRLPRRGADGRPRRDRPDRHDLVGRGDLQHSGVEIAYPGISTWKITAVGKTAHPTEPEHGINAVTKMAKLVEAVDQGRLELPKGDLAMVRAAGHDQRHPHPPRRRLGDPGAAATRCSRSSRPAGASLAEVRDAIDAFLRMLEQEDGEVRFERKILPMGAGRLWLQPGESDPDSPGVKALAAAIRGSRPQRARGRASSTAAGSTRSR